MSDPRETQAVPQDPGRRSFLKVAGAGVAGSSLLTMLSARQAPAQVKGTSLRMLKWSHFVPAYDAWFDDFAKKWGEKTGVKVRVDHIPHLELPARYAAEFAAGAGHDLIYFVGQILTGQYYKNLLDLSDLANGLGQKYGGWMENAKSAAQVAGTWYAVPDFFISIPVLWRKDLFDSIGRPAPKTWDDLRAAARLLKPKGHPTGMQFSHCNDANHNWRALMYCFGVKETDPSGQNIALDAGTFSYNAPEPWDDPLSKTAYHDTVCVDGRDQMLHFRKFKCLYWTSAKLLRFEDNADWVLCVGEHYGYQRHPGHCVHRRSVLFLKDDFWVVVDRIEGSGTHRTHRIRLHWLGGDFPYRSGLDGQTSLQLETPDGPFHLAVFNAVGRPLSGEIVAGQDDPPRGWLSRYYAEKVPVPSLSIEVSGRLPLTMVSLLGPHVPSVTVSDSTWSVMSGERMFEFELAAGEIQLRSLKLISAPVA